MPLILAIEPDRRQAAKIAALAKNPLRADLLVAESTEKAFVALGSRVPDVILTSLLLSPKDEAALDDRLRRLDAAGTHVQTLVIPVLGTAVRGAREGGLLKRLTGSKRRGAAPDACDPAVFAAQITEYLDRAAAERRAAAVALEDELPVQQDPVYATRQKAQLRVAPMVVRLDGPAVGEPRSDDGLSGQWEPVHVVVAKGESSEQPSAVPPRREEDPWGEIVRDEQPPMRVTETASEAGVVFSAEPIGLAAFEEELHSAKSATGATQSTVAKAGGAAREAAARDKAAREAAARERAAREEAAREQSTREAAARENAAREAAAREAAMREAAAREEAAREAAVRDKAAREAAAREAAKREAAAREKAAREAAAREAAAREKAAQEAAARERAAREQAAREALARSLSIPLDADLAEFVAGIEAAAAAEKAARRPPLSAEDAPAIVASARPQGKVPSGTQSAADAPAAPPEWMQLLTAIKRDIEQLRTDRPETGADPSASQESSDHPPARGRSGVAGAEPSRAAQTKKRKKGAAPVQDEWGFFDPEECGFAALLKKLDEITDQEETPAKKPVGPRR